MEEDVEMQSIVFGGLGLFFGFFFPFGKWPRKVTKKRQKGQKVNHLLLIPGDKPAHCSKKQNAAVISPGSEESIAQCWVGGRGREKEK